MLQVRPYESNGLSFIIPSQGQTLNVNLDGNGDSKSGAGSALPGRRLDARTVEILRTTNGKMAEAEQISLSPDLGILDDDRASAGEDEPYVYVFERQ